MAGQAEVNRWLGHRHDGRRLSTFVSYVRHGGRECTAWTDSRQPTGDQDVPGGWLRGGSRFRQRAPVPQGFRPGSRILLDGRVAGLLDGVPDSGAHDASVKNGVCVVRPGGERTRGQRTPGGGG